jgi:hypothetical protein
MLAPIGLLRSRSFVPTTVNSDPHSSLTYMTQEFSGVGFDLGGAGDNVLKVDT